MTRKADERQVTSFPAAFDDFTLINAEAGLMEAPSAQP